MSPSLFPEMTILREVLDEGNFGNARELAFNAQELALLDAGALGGARGASLYDELWPPRF